MPASVLVAGLDGRSLLLEAPVLQRERHAVLEVASGRALVEEIVRNGARLVVLGSQLPDLDLPDAIGRVRASALARHVSILVLVASGASPSLEAEAQAAGANAVLRRPLDPAQLEAWIAKLIAVARRVETRVPVQGRVVGTPRNRDDAHFYGLSRNLSVTGMLLASPVRLAEGPDLELEFDLPGAVPGLQALGRVVRQAGEVAWPYIGYGVEFLYLPAMSFDAIVDLVSHGGLRPAAIPPDATHGIHSTVRREAWVYEILEPVRRDDTWHAEIRRAPREDWRPGEAGPFYVVEGASPEKALREARDFLIRLD
jgi:CheY-like chemotaxis protein